MTEPGHLDPEVQATREVSPESLPGVLVIALTVAGIGVSIFYVFGFSVQGVTLLDHAYYNFLIACFLGGGFLVLKARRKDSKCQWYDFAGAALAFGIPFYWFLSADAIRSVSWMSWLSPLNIGLAFIECLLVVEAGRRMAGLVFLGVCLAVGLYPLVAGHMPGILYGTGSSFPRTLGFYVFGSDGLLGLPTKVMGNTLIAFLVFAGALSAGGAGRFFINLALVLFGRFRGGAAKVSVFASCLFGTLSGSAISNVVATGVFTIPAMKRTGYPSYYAGAVEACASTGGMIMPPVMGAVAFVMASFLSIPYAAVVTAAIIPAVLYYLGLLLQIDAYAAKTGLKGLAREEVPPLKETLAEGWPFLAVLVFMVWGLLWMKWEAKAAFYASGLIFLLSFHRRESMMTPGRILRTFIVMGKVIVQTMAVILPIGFIIGGLVVTGTTAAFTATLVNLGGGNIFLVLLLGAIACYIMGMAGLMVPAYIFLAVSLAPAAIQVGGVPPISIHMFILYYATLAVFTPPVATAAFVAAAIAGAPPMKTAVTAMRLGVILYFIPFFFVLRPALIVGGGIMEVLSVLVPVTVGIILIAGGLEGYLWKVGRLPTWSRSAIILAGILIGLPNWPTAIGGAIIAGLAIAWTLRRKVVVAARPLQEGPAGKAQP